MKQRAPSEPPLDEAPRTLGAFLDRQAALFAERPAVAGEARGLDYRGLRDASDRVAAALVAAGVTKGTRVGLLMENRAEWLPYAFGVCKAGGLLVGLNTLQRKHELEYALRHADVSVAIAVPQYLKHDYAAMLAALAAPVLSGGIAANLPFLRRVVLVGEEARDGFDAAAALLAAGERIGRAELAAVGAAVSPSDPAAVFFTSGSTATPKAAVLSHAALLHNAWAIADSLGLGPSDRTWTALPLFFSGGFCLCALPSLAAGACVVLNAAFDAGAALERLERERCTVMVGWNHVPAMLEHPSFPARRLVLAKGVGGNLPLADRFLRPGHSAVGNYGMTETATVCCSARFDDPPEVRRTFGRPIRGAEVRIVSADTGEPLPPGAEGEIVVRSPAMMSHYYGASPADCFDREGYFHTGDLGFFDERGCLHFVKRLKDVIKTMGVNVAAPEVERFLETHPEVRRAVVVGVPHATRGENVAAFVVPTTGELDEASVVAHCRGGLASYKVPRHVFLVAEADLPISASGKVEKGRLREEAARRAGGAER